MHIAEQAPVNIALSGRELVLATGITHEAGYAALAIATGGGVYLIRVTSPDGGHTLPWHPTWFSSVVGTFAGYAAPPPAGLGTAALLAEGKVRSVLVLTVVAMALVLLVSCELAGVWVLVTARIRGHGSDSDDDDALARTTSVPSPVWILAWLALNGWAVWVAVPLLWP